MIGPLVDPEAHGGRAEDAFHVVIPSLPGFGFSTPVRARLGHPASPPRPSTQIMQALGYERYGVSGGDVGAGIAEQLCIHAGERVIGSLVVTDPGAIATEYTPPTDHLTDDEQARHEALKAARAEDFGYIALQTTRPQSIAYGLTDSPVMQLTWIVEKVKEWTDPAKELPEDAVDLDHLLTLVSVYWFGGGGAGAANFLYEAAHADAAWGATHDRPQGFVAFGERAAGPPDPRSGAASSPTGTSTPRAATSRRWRCRTSSSATCGRSSPASAEGTPAGPTPGSSPEARCRLPRPFPEAGQLGEVGLGLPIEERDQERHHEEAGHEQRREQHEERPHVLGQSHGLQDLAVIR